ncbi:MAG: hypothetical protein RL885_07300 [Planctomycetota bacterium]
MLTALFSLALMLGDPGPSSAEPTATREILPFRPSLHGLPFVNSFPVKLEIPLGFTSWKLRSDFGLCGGMIYRTLDAWEGGEEVDRDQTRPKFGSDRYWDLMQRQTETLVPGVWAKVLKWQQRPDRETRWCPLSSLRRMVPGELAKVRDRIDRGWAVPICLIRRSGLSNPSYNHQVLVYGYEQSGRETTLHVYDPNHPNDDSIRIAVRVGRNRLYLSQSSGEHNRGLFVLSYDRQRAQR